MVIAWNVCNALDKGVTDLKAIIGIIFVLGGFLGIVYLVEETHFTESYVGLGIVIVLFALLGGIGNALFQGSNNKNNNDKQ